jgi:hypothetical protein
LTTTVLQEQWLAYARRRTAFTRAIDQYGQVIAVLLAERGFDVQLEGCARCAGRDLDLWSGRVIGLRYLTVVNRTRVLA